MSTCITGRHVFACLSVLQILTVITACALHAGSNADALQPDSPALGTYAELTLDNITSLPAAQRALFADPRWLATPALVESGTELPAPTAQQLAKATSTAQAHGEQLNLPAQFNTENLRRQVSAAIAKGEYEAVAPDEIPPFGCNNDASNSSNGHAIEDVIAAAEEPVQPVAALDYVTTVPSQEDYWPSYVGGSGNDALSAVQQLYSTDPDADPGDPGTPAEFGMFSYRADLAPGIGPGGDCSAAQAYSVTGQYWKRFNSAFNILPAGEVTELYNLLISPSGQLSDPATSVGSTAGRYQPFYFGTVSAAFGGAWIVGLENSSSNCEYFNDALGLGASTGFFVRPIYGVLLKHWQQSALQGMAGPWEGRLGWPVFGPIAYANGTAVLTARGTYYAWGMWFERGFLWWVDYDQRYYPNAADEAQLWIYSGDNVYCNDGDDRYRKAGPPVYYNDAGPLGVNVVVESLLNDTGLAYEVALVDGEGGPEAVLNLHAHGYGGTPDEQLRYKYTLWNLGDGTIINDSTAFVDDTEYVTHSYTEPGTYTIRVMLVDATDASQFGYSMPIVVQPAD